MTAIFRSRGGVELDTPVAELKSVLAMLIFDMADQGGEISSLYDLTVPLLRYMACNNLRQFRGYQIGKVYRRDQPNTKNA